MFRCVLDRGLCRRLKRVYKIREWQSRGRCDRRNEGVYMVHVRSVRNVTTRKPDVTKTRSIVEPTEGVEEVCGGVDRGVTPEGTVTGE